MTSFDYFIAYDEAGETIAEGESLGAVELQAKDYCDKTKKMIIINGYESYANDIIESDGRILKSETLLEKETELLTIISTI